MGLITDFLVHAVPEERLNELHPTFIAVQTELIPECSITQLVCEDGEFEIEALAAVKHLIQ